MIGTTVSAQPTRAARALEVVLRRPWLVTAVLCAVVLALPAAGPDHAASAFRAAIFRDHRALLWDNEWYSGHLLAGYSLLFPPLAALVGPRPLGALAAVAAAAAAGLVLGGPRAGRRNRVAALWFAVLVVGELLIGRLPFLLGVALGLGAVLAIRRDRPVLAAVAALLCSLSSPLSGAFLLLVGISWAVEIGIRRTAPLAGAVAGLATAALLGGGGSFPFPATTLLLVLTYALVALVVVPRHARALRVGLLLYAVASVVLFAVPNPVGGGNMMRLGALTAGPVAALVLGRSGSWARSRARRWTVAGVGVAAAVVWQLAPITQAVAWSVKDPSSQPSYYAGLQAFLATQDPTRGRLEIPSLRQHWEAAYVAPAFPLARGWERQVDISVNAPLYDPELDAAGLHAWLRQSGVTLVALPDAPMDHYAKREVAILRSRPSWLVPVWSDAHWRVWRVADAPGLTYGPGRVTALGVDSFTLQATAAARVVVRLHWNPYWQVTAGVACVVRTPDDWTAVVPAAPGPVTVVARWSVGGMATRADSPRCFPPS